MAIKRLRFDIDSFMQVYIDFMISVVDDLVEQAMSEMQQRANNSMAKQDYEKITTKTYYNQSVVYVMGGVVAGAYAILDSFGTGTNMDRNNENLNEYMQSQYWNKSRSSFAVVGRTEGETYKDVFGNSVVGKGMSGEKTGGIKPSYAIQEVENRLYSTRIQAILSQKMNEFMALYFDKFWIYK